MVKELMGQLMAQSRVALNGSLEFAVDKESVHTVDGSAFSFDAFAEIVGFGTGFFKSSGHGERTLHIHIIFRGQICPAVGKGVQMGLPFGDQVAFGVPGTFRSDDLFDVGFRKSFAVKTQIVEKHIRRHQIGVFPFDPLGGDVKGTVIGSKQIALFGGAFNGKFTVKVDADNAVAEDCRHMAPVAGTFDQMGARLDPFVVGVVGAGAEVADIIDALIEILAGKVFVEESGVAPADRKDELQ